MAADDLSKPLKGGKGGKTRAAAKGGVRVVRAFNVAVGTIFVAALVLGGWLVLRGDPHSGEPVAVISLKAGDRQVGEGDAVSGAQMRESVGPGGERAEAAEGGAPGQAGDGDGMVRITIHGGKAPEEEQAPPGDVPPPAAAEPGALEPPPAAESGKPAARLARAPDPGLVEKASFGQLPRIGNDGRRPAEVYARRSGVPAATGQDAPPRIAIMIGALGISASGTDLAIKRLPAAVSLAFAPYGRDLQTWVDKARQNGHEVLLQLPMEPFDYPDNDPGPHTLLTGSSPAENLERLHWLMARMTGYFAVTNYMGAKFTAEQQALIPILDEINRRGLAFVDDGSSPRTTSGAVASSLGLPAGVGDVIIDAGQTRDSIGMALQRLEAMARERGFALGVGSGLPATIEEIARWSNELKSRGIVLVPVSALTAQQRQS